MAKIGKVDPELLDLTKYSRWFVVEYAVGRSPKGNIIFVQEAEIEARDQEHARQRVVERGHYPISVSSCIFKAHPKK
jgi:hypothetical protein